MREIQILSTANSKSEYDANIGHFIIKKQDEDDITLLYNYRYKVIKENTVESGKIKYGVEVIANDEEYIVKPLDSIYRIAKMYNIAVEDIMLKNNLKDDKLFIGQILRI